MVVVSQPVKQSVRVSTTQSWIESLCVCQSGWLCVCESVCECECVSVCASQRLDLCQCVLGRRQAHVLTNAGLRKSAANGYVGSSRCAECCDDVCRPLGLLVVQLSGPEDGHAQGARLCKFSQKMGAHCERCLACLHRNQSPSL